MADSSLPTSSNTFNQLFFSKLRDKNAKPHTAKCLRFSYHRDKYGNVQANLKHKNFVDDQYNEGHYLKEWSF
jgi:hypothetical protein